MRELIPLLVGVTLSVGIFAAVQTQALRSGRYVYQYPLALYGAGAMVALTTLHYDPVDPAMWVAALIIMAVVHLARVRDREGAEEYESALAENRAPRDRFANIPRAYRGSVVVMLVLLLLLLGLLGHAAWASLHLG